jgi:hypothetical protein
VLDGLLGDTGFMEARAALLAAIATQSVEQPLADGQAAPTLDSLDPELQKHVALTPGESMVTLEWIRNLPPNDAERALIAAEVARLTSDDPLGEALAALHAAFNTAPPRPFTVAMAEPPSRPSNEHLGQGLLADNLSMTPTSLNWQGLPADAAAYAALGNLATEFGDPAFQQAITTIQTELENLSIRVTMDIPLRPQQDDLGALAEQLLLGRAIIRYHGLMTAEEGHAMLDVFTRSVDRQAIRRLYAAAAGKGLNGRSIFVRARRGNAAPSVLLPITLEELSQ